MVEDLARTAAAAAAAAAAPSVVVCRVSKREPDAARSKSSEGGNILARLKPRLTPSWTLVTTGSVERTAPGGRSHAVTSVSGL